MSLLFFINQNSMAFYWVKTNRFIKRLFSQFVWDIPNTDNIVYLTFDDGPTPEITEWTLSQLKNYNAKATFFCIGDNVVKHPEIFNKVIADGHAVGNHTFNHLNGWKTDSGLYIDNVKKCAESMKGLTAAESFLFRPPYGKIKRSQSKEMIKLGYRIVMWDILSADFDQHISREKCLENVLSNIKSGNIIIFHDSIKAFRNLEYVLPETLKFLREKGFKCEVIS